MGTAFRDDVMKWLWEVELLPPFRRVLGLLKGSVISEYAQYLFSEALAQASISNGSTMKAEAMNWSAKIYFEEGCMFQCTSNTQSWYNHDLHWKYYPTHYSIKLEESTHGAQERSQRSLCSMHSEANKSRQVWGWGYLDVFGYFLFCIF